MEFQIGQSALDVCKVVVEHQSEISELTLISHEVGINWRQRYETEQERLEHQLAGFEHSKPIKQQDFSRNEFNNVTPEMISELRENQVYSITSKVGCNDRIDRHIPMMNFHNTSLQDIKSALEYICGKRKGVILNSGRFFHYYGDFLLDEDKWTSFMGEFLMPTVLVSPRYIGHRIHDGYSTLRLTADKKYKPCIPKVVELLG
jgi:hypothetical protein